ncbi:MAG: ABC transporter permease [Candidatus Latescibacterota bacterium]|nr:ABC transporter permease [Candidatus Latescibacterota bacterium]
MFGALVVRELCSHMLTYRFALSACLLFTLIVGSALILGFSYDRQLSAYSESKNAREQKLSESTDFQTLRWQGMQQEKPPNPLSVFTVGLERELSRSVTISNRQPKLGRSKYSSALYTLFPPPDLLYIVNIVGSLLAVLFAFNAISGDHEDGTLRLVMSNAVPRHMVLLSKWAGGYLALMVPFLGSVMAALLVISALTVFRLTGAEWGAFGAMLGVAALYLSVFYTLALAISVYTRRSSTSLVVSFLVWVLLVLAVPNVAPIIARAAVKIPSPGAIAGERDAIRTSAWAEMRGRDWRSMSREERTALRDKIDARIEQNTARIIDDYTRRLESQVSAGVALARISPSSSYVYATASLAGAGLADFSGLRQYIDRYRVQYLDAIDAIDQQRRRQTEGIEDRQERDEIREAPVDPDDLPAFAPQRRPMGEILAASDIDLLVLVVLNGVFFLVAYLGFLKFDLVD